MIDRKQHLSPHFLLGELIPEDCDFVPPWVMGELTDLCHDLLEPTRTHFGPVVIHDGYRPLEYNERVGGAKDSDHLDGKAADFHVTGDLDHAWQERTISAFHWARESLEGKFGQLILEDHREHYQNQAKIWIHVSTPTGRHPGTGHDLNSVLVSFGPGHYRAFAEASASA